MKEPAIVYVLVWTGRQQDADEVLRRRYAGCEIVRLPAGELRLGGWRGQVRKLRNLRGDALVFFFDSIEDAREPELLAWCGLFHHCRETALADRTGWFEVYRRIDWLRMLPATIWSGLSDAFAFIFTWLLLRALIWLKPKPVDVGLGADADLDVAFLFPQSLKHPVVGGAMSHVRGFLEGLAEESARGEIFSGCRLPFDPFPIFDIPLRRRFYLFWESQLLLYNLRFAGQVRKLLRGRRPRAFYQRHGRYVFAGALLSLKLRIPLVLEYNGSEVWIARHWDPSRFPAWLRLCEDFSLSIASLVVVVSEPLRDDVLGRGVPEERILVNPNAASPAQFQPGCGGSELRRELGFADRDVVVGFVGTFSYWHGVEILHKAILELLGHGEQEAGSARLRFLLVGDGPLCAEMREALEGHERSGTVVFTGLVAHDRVAAHLDAADILVSPHLRLPDGDRFFGSPTKLFEYMAMAKAIVASNLDQLSQVLEHGKTAWLVAPGEPTELASAIKLLRGDPKLRGRLGAAARAQMLAHHTWRQNARRVLERLRRGSRMTNTADGSHSAVPRSEHSTLLEPGWSGNPSPGTQKRER